MAQQIKQRRWLGASGISVPALGVGTNRWGAGQIANDATAFRVFQTSLDKGMNFFETAEVYTGGNSERLLGDCIRRDVRPAVIASKFAPLPNRLSPHALMDALDDSLNRLGLEGLDLYQIHWPYTLLNGDALMDMMALAVRTGKIRAVGVSNYSAKQMHQAATRLARYQIPLACNEVHYSLLHRQPEVNGVLDACRELNVALIAYQPLENGLLREPDPDTAPRRADFLAFARKARQEQVTTLQETLRTIAHSHGKTVSQAALNWLLQRDEHIIPIPGTTNIQHLTDNLETLSWQLSDDEFAKIDQASLPWKK